MQRKALLHGKIGTDIAAFERCVGEKNWNREGKRKFSIDLCLQGILFIEYMAWK
jgi:hypothetical protein